MCIPFYSQKKQKDFYFRKAMSIDLREKFFIYCDPFKNIFIKLELIELIVKGHQNKKIDQKPRKPSVDSC